MRIKLGDVGVLLPDKGGLSAGFMLTDTGLHKGSGFRGTFSGGPIGLSSRFRFLFFSLSSRLLFVVFLSLRSSPDFGAIGVMVIDVDIMGGAD